MDFEPERDYPLGTKRPDLVTTPGGVPPAAAAPGGPPPGGACLPAPGRAASRAEKELRRELLVSPLPELGLVAFDGPNDPQPELVVEGGPVVRMDGPAAADLDVIRRSVAPHHP